MTVKSRYSLTRVEALLKKVVKRVDALSKKVGPGSSKSNRVLNQRAHLSSRLYARKKKLGG
jgi:hypothetical protein